MQKAWFSLLVAGSLEVVWACFLHLSRGFSELVPTVLTILFCSICFYFLEKAIQVLGTGISYAVFTGMGTVGTAIVGVMFLGDEMKIMQVIAITLILVAIVGLKTAESIEEG